ncbi:response regulator transcription factor [Acinetobacter sp. YH12134]|uniref:response regulator n=1 Tax=Acinetobacter sp. YH12134 TaxID=2601118 RepID=UPI0015D461A7
MDITESILPAPVLIVEDEPMIQSRLRHILLEMGYSNDMLIFVSHLKAALQKIEEQPVSLALVDLGLPDGNGIELIEQLRAKDSNVLILVISAWSTQNSLFSAIQAGATGYVLKERDDTEVIMAIRSILRGGAPIDPFIAREILSQISVQKPQEIAKPFKQPDEDIEQLTNREHEILNLVAQGLSNREIAEQLFVSRYTVESHIKHIYRKLSVSKRTKAVSTARSLGIL